MGRIRQRDAFHAEPVESRNSRTNAVAFARIGSRINADRSERHADGIAGGRRKYSFPVIVGMNSGEPPSTRAPRMKIYNTVVRDWIPMALTIRRN